MLMSGNPVMLAVGLITSPDEEESLRRVVGLLLEHGAKVISLQGGSEECVSIHPAIMGRRATLIKELAAAQRPPFNLDSEDAAACLKIACMAADPATVSAR